MEFFAASPTLPCPLFPTILATAVHQMASLDEDCVSAAEGLLQPDYIAPQWILHTRNIDRSPDSVRAIYRHRPYVVCGNCDLPSTRTCSIRCLFLSHEAPFCSASPRRPAHLPFPERILFLLTCSSPFFRFPRRYASVGAIDVGSNGLACGFTWQLTANSIGCAAN